jgi:hypothetical protein
MASEAGACQTRNVNDYDDEEKDEKDVKPLDEVRGRGRQKGPAWRTEVILAVAPPFSYASS